MPQVKLIEDIYWSYDSSKPQAKIRGYLEEVDPFPCYHHDMALVEKAVAEVEASFPIDPKRGPRWNVLAYDSTGHTNGWTSTSTNYDEPRNAEGNYEWGIVIAMMGKRTPLHPAMTRFIVAHEYGHAVERVLEVIKGYERDGSRPILTEYAKLRGMERDESLYGARTWHLNMGEIFADDFRLLIPKVELEHWPHPDVTRPENLSDIRAWWAGAKELWAYKETVNASTNTTPDPER